MRCVLGPAPLCSPEFPHSLPEREGKYRITEVPPPAIHTHPPRNPPFHDRLSLLSECRLGSWIEPPWSSMPPQTLSWCAHQHRVDNQFYNATSIIIFFNLKFHFYFCFRTIKFKAVLLFCLCVCALLGGGRAFSRLSPAYPAASRTLALPKGL